MSTYETRAISVCSTDAQREAVGGLLGRIRRKCQPRVLKSGSVVLHWMPHNLSSRWHITAEVCTNGAVAFCGGPLDSVEHGDAAEAIVMEFLSEH